MTVSPSQAFSAFFYTVDFLRTVMGLPVATLQQLESAVVTVCSQTWTEVRPAPPSKVLGFLLFICSKSRGAPSLRAATAVETPLVRPEKWRAVAERRAPDEMGPLKPPEA